MGCTCDGFPCHRQCQVFARSRLPGVRHPVLVAQLLCPVRLMPIRDQRATPFELLLMLSCPELRPSEVDARLSDGIRRSASIGSTRGLIAFHNPHDTRPGTVGRGKRASGQHLNSQRQAGGTHPTAVAEIPVH